MNPALADLECALDRLEEALLSPEVAKEEAHLLPHFRECFDLACEAIRGELREEEAGSQPPLHYLRLAFQAGWLHEEEMWVAMYQDWRRSTASGIEDFDGFFRRLPHYLRAFERLGASLARFPACSGL
ncbi:hypothetical protein [Thiohalorhabdus methylotrophus]|uniref:Uncharacterized protein n=1 Tax=Thiohalorhabdus methylotrophus TaxID=3242694 RepID=A0ABV4TV27_9GAMM